MQGHAYNEICKLERLSVASVIGYIVAMNWYVINIDYS